MNITQYLNVFKDEKEKKHFSEIDFSSNIEGHTHQNVNKGYIPQAAGGKIKFQLEGMDTGVVASKYLFVEDESTLQMGRIMSDFVGKWDLPSPKLILTVLSSTKHSKQWRFPEDVENFQDGLIKAASLADMMILVNGQNQGVTTIIGDAVAKERNRRKILSRELALVRFNVSTEPLPRLCVIGLLPQQALSQTVSDSVTECATTPTPGKTNILINQSAESIDQTDNDINMNLTHYLIMNKEMGRAGQANFVNRLEMRLTRPLADSAIRRPSLFNEDEIGSVPLIGLLVQGGPQEIDHVLSLVKKNVPVIVLCGLGMAGDIIAYAVRESQQSYDNYTYEMYVKTELRRLLTTIFPEFQGNMLARNQCRDRVLQCVSFATQGESSLLTLVDVHAQGQDLSKVILMAVLNSYNLRQTQAEQIQFSLQLCLDWMSPGLAHSEIFSKYSSNLITVTDDLFQQALLRNDREGFVELFLERGFVLHNFLNQDRLELLFERCQDKDFFVGICLETILGVKLSQYRHISDNFVRGTYCDLNRLLQILTGLNNLIDPEELNMNAMANRAVNPQLAERKAMYALTYWAALTNNIKIVRILWRLTGEPVAMSLTLSTLFSRMSRYWIDDHDLKLVIKKQGVEFGEIAVKTLDLAYIESKFQAMRSLTESLPDFKDLSIIDLARLGKNKYFIAHPCCQRLIYNLWYGCVRFNRHYNVGFSELPDSVKMILSMILIFPSYIWIDIVQDSRCSPAMGKSGGHFNAIERATRRNRKSMGDTTDSLPFENIRSVFLIQKLYYMWTAPVTKYWLTQLFYMLFLGVYSMSVMSPFCGDPSLNIVVAAWLLAFLVDQIFLSVTEKLQGSDATIPELGTLLMTSYTLVVVVVFRLMKPTALSFPVVKIMLSCSLIFFFYKAMGLMFPASQALGPMFLNLTRMMRQDLLRWLRIWSLTLISGGIAIHAVLYPAYPLDITAVSRSFLRGFLGLFLTDVSDLAGDSCSCLYSHSSTFNCDVENIPESVRNKLETCPYSSAGGYFVVLLYLFDTKLVYYTLIFAICSVTMAQTYEKSVEIWKYQFFLMVRDYTQRPFLPVPFVIIIYPFLLLQIISVYIYHFLKENCPFWDSEGKRRSLDDYNMWRPHIKTLKKQEQIDTEKQNLIKGSQQRLSEIARQQTTFRRVIRNLNDRMTELLTDQTSNSLMMEQLDKTVEALRLNKTEDDLPQSLHHRQCRLSPYPGTSIRRFAVFDKNVSWEEPYPTYDPPIYTKPVAEYDDAIRHFVDPDFFELQRMREEQEKLDPLEVSDAELIPEFNPEYNEITDTTALNGEQFLLDRTAWVAVDKPSAPYSLDISGVPRNPMGRTGLRGRGNLWRWGPNHVMFAIVSRWRSAFNSAGVPQGPLLVNGKKVLEILVVYNERLKEDSLPGAFASGRTSKYSVLCEMFMRDLMGEKDVPGSTQLDQDDMIQFYRQFVSSELLLSSLLSRSRSVSSNSGSFSSQLIYRGYIDDRSNTDNAWIDAEIWNFHYSSRDKFDKKIIDNDKRWREVSVLMQLVSSQLHHVLEVAKMHNQA